MGFIEVSPSIPPFAHNLDLTCYIVDFSFSDGVQTRNPSNSVVCKFDVSTDGEGYIVEWSAYFRESNITAGMDQFTLDTSSYGDQVGIGPAQSDPCGGFSATAGALNATTGSWNQTLPMGTPMVYTYLGNTYTAVEPPYTFTDQLAGSFQLAVPLPAALPLTELAHAVQSYSFDDGAEVRNDSNSEICSFQLATDLAGHIKQWEISIREVPFTTGVGQHSISTSSLSDMVGVGPAGVVACDNLVLSPTANVSDPGSWSDSLPPGSPTDYLYEGSLFGTVQPPYTTAQRIAGWVRFSGPLPPFLSNENVQDELVDFQFDDGLQLRTPLNSVVCGFFIATDMNGHIINWSVTFRASSFVPGQLQHTLQLGQAGDIAGSVTAGPDACSSSSFVVSGTSDVAGVWADNLPPSTPAVYIYRGESYDAASLPFSRRHSVTGRILLSSPLIANLNQSEFGDHLMSYQFHDGLVSYQNHDASRCLISLATDESAQIVHWQMQFLHFSPPSHLVRIVNKGLQIGDFAGGVASGSCETSNFSYQASTDQSGSWVRMCPDLLASLPEWPQPTNILGLLALNCGW